MNQYFSPLLTHLHKHIQRLRQERGDFAQYKTLQSLYVFYRGLDLRARLWHDTHRPVETHTQKGMP